MTDNNSQKPGENHSINTSNFYSKERTLVHAIGMICVTAVFLQNKIAFELWIAAMCFFAGISGVAGFVEKRNSGKIAIVALTFVSKILAASSMLAACVLR